MISNFAPYWNAILARAWKRAVERFGWWGIVLDLFVAAMVTWITKRPKSWVDVGSSEVFLAFMAFVGIFFIVLIFFILVEPVIYDNEKNDLLEKWESGLIKTNKVFVSAKEEGAWKGIQYVWLEVNNQEPDDLCDCYATLREVKVKRKKFERWLNLERAIIENSNKLTWPGVGTGEKIVRRNNSERLNLVKLQADKIYFTLGDGDRKLLDIIPYQIYIEVSFSGKLNGKPIEEILIHGLLVIEMTGLGPRFYLLKSDVPSE